MNQALDRTRAERMDDSVFVSPEEQTPGRTWILGLTGFLFSVLQSICALFLTISGVRTLIGLGAFAASGLGAPVLAFHADAIRIPMLTVAIVGSILNLLAIGRVRSLRARPAAAWRAQPVSARTRTSERLQIALAMLTLVLVLVELVAHLKLHGA